MAFLVVKAIDVRASRLFNTYYLLEPGSYTEPWFSDMDRIELEKTTSEVPLTTTSRRGSTEKKVTNVSLKKNEKKDRRKSKDVVGELSSYYLRLIMNHTTVLTSHPTEAKKQRRGWFFGINVRDFDDIPDFE